MSFNTLIKEKSYVEKVISKKKVRKHDAYNIFYETGLAVSHLIVFVPIKVDTKDPTKDPTNFGKIDNFKYFWLLRSFSQRLWSS